ncbi:MAG: TlpA family protein disulfide reductase [Cytophagales bacterium]|nr:TlpA family protein disulfide reductase [Cytophagales bacterium]
MKLTKIVCILFFGSVFLSCKEEPGYLQIGNWRGTFTVQNIEIPFNFRVEDDTAGLVKVLLTNGEEKFQLDSVRYERDSVIVPIDVYDALLIGKLAGDSLKGYFRKNQSGKQGIPFAAIRGQASRFNTNSATPVSIGGKWSVSLLNEKNETHYTVGLLNQDQAQVNGTILTTTGDFRYFQGVIDGDSLKISGFSGSNPSLLRAKIVDSLHLTGELISPAGLTQFVAIKSDTARLPDPYALTYLKEGYDRLDFTFPNLSGNPVSLQDEKYKNKVVVITIMGSWCPNCVDEAAFLAPWYKENKTRGVEIVALSFERKDDLAFARERISKFIKRFDIEYEILFAGLADKAQASEKLPALNRVLSFPTTIIIDRKGKVRKIHTGFSGPATGEYYQEFIRHFNEDVTTLLNESENAI